MRSSRFASRWGRAFAAVLLGFTAMQIAGAQCVDDCVDITYSTSGSGSVTCFDCEEVASNEVAITIVAESTGIFTIDIQCFDGVRIVSCNVKNTGDPDTRLVIDFEDGDMDGLAQVMDFRKSTAMDSTGEVWIANMQPSGNIGPAVLHTDAKIRADKIGTLRTNAGLTAEVIVHGSAITDEHVAIETIDVGELAHDITAENDQIGTITVSGDIGDPAFDDP